MLRCWSEAKGFGDDERRTERSRGGGLGKTRGVEIGGDRIGSDVTSSAQLRGGDGGEVIQMGLGVETGCGDVCELASCVPRGVVWTAELAVLGVLCSVGRGFSTST